MVPKKVLHYKVFCLLTRSMRMTCLFVIKRRIHRYHFKCNNPKKEGLLHSFYCILGIYITNFEHFQKTNERYSLRISEIMDFERRGYLNA